MKGRLADLVAFGAPTFDDIVRVLRSLDQVSAQLIDNPVFEFNIRIRFGDLSSYIKE